MANGIIENSIPANEFRTRIPDKMALKNGDADNSVAKHKIFITDGNIDTVNNKFVPRIVGKNIIDAVNAASADGKTVANATHAVNADNATNVVLTTTANADGSTTIKAGTGSATIENCINAKVADFANRGKLSIDNDSTNGDQIWIGNPPATNAVNINNARNARYALYASLDETKGTIEERLTNLGFRKGTIGELTSNLRVYFDCVLDKDNTYVYKQGNIVWGKITFAPSVNKNCETTKRTIHVASITTTGFKPHTKISCGVLCFGKSNTGYTEYVKNIMDAYIETDGSVKVTYLAEESGARSHSLDLHQMFFAYDVTGNH